MHYYSFLFISRVKIQKRVFINCLASIQTVVRDSCSLERFSLEGFIVMLFLCGYIRLLEMLFFWEILLKLSYIVVDL